MNTPIKKPEATALANGLDTTKQNFFKLNYSWSLPTLASTEQEMHWRQLTNSNPFEAVIEGFYAHHYFEQQLSSINRMVIQLPERFNPSVFSWPVSGLDVAIVETGCYERVLLELCVQYGANFVIVQDRTFAPKLFQRDDVLAVAA